jgi:putative ABC transport system permease protein
MDARRANSPTQPPTRSSTGSGRWGSEGTLGGVDRGAGSVVLKLALRGVLAHKVRLGLTAFAIVLGVAFVSGTFMFTDSIRKSFTSIFESVNEGVDLYVRGSTAFGFQRGLISEDVADDIAALDGVDFALPSVEGIAQLVDRDGGPIGGSGPPTLGFSFLADEEGLTPLAIRDGRWPTGDAEIVIDSFSADDNGFGIGDDIDVILPVGVEAFTVVGVASFAGADNLLGATLSVFEFRTAQRVFDAQGLISTISVRISDGADGEAVRAAIDEVLPDGAEVITAQSQTDEILAEVDEGLGFINTILLVIAGVGVFVGAFLIQNTFRIIVSQRTRELALLRAIGATGRQVTRLVGVEALIVGVVASAVGIGVGALLATGIKAAFAGFGFGIPATGTVIAARTVIVGFAVGVGVTLAAALIPARRAAKVPPVAALQDIQPSSRSLRRRILAGASVAGFGALAVLIGLFASIDNALTVVGLGSAILFVGVSMLAPLVARGFARVAGAPLPRAFGVVGRLAQENAMRRPRRTAATASALMIGVSLVTLIAVFSSSAKEGVAEVFHTDFDTDFQVQVAGFSDPRQVGLPPALTERLRQVPELGAVARIRTGEFRFAGETAELFVAAADGDLHLVANLDSEGGDASQFGPGTALVSLGSAREQGLSVGSVVAIEFPDGAVVDLVVASIFDNPGLGYSLVVDLATFEQHSPFRLDQIVMIQAASGVDLGDARDAIAAVTADYPNAELTTSEEFIRSVEEQIDGVLNLLSVLLGFAVVIALMGIINTLALSVIERKRELGLLRAVGMRRRQVRRMVRWEAILIATFGASLGLVVGVVLGIAVVQAIGQGLKLAVPVGTLVAYVLVAAIGGTLAAIIPARRAARLDILDAIAYE